MRRIYADNTRVDQLFLLKKMKRIIIFTGMFGILSVSSLLVVSCGHSGYREPASDSGQFNDDGGGSSAHPATSLTEQFHVKRAYPSHSPSNNYEFFFKRCNLAGEDWPYSRTSYDCSYP